MQNIIQAAQDNVTIGETAMIISITDWPSMLVLIKGLII